jgi:hypothetical protein
MKGRPGGPPSKGGYPTSPGGPGPGGPGPGGPGPGGKFPRPGSEGPGPGMEQPDLVIPEYCLVRLIDVTVQPGKTYQYRFQVKMGNPNFGHTKDVASPGYAKDKELKSYRWYEVPQKVVVPPEMQYYAVDQAKVEKDYKGQNWRDTPDSGRQAVLQIHRWLDHVPYNKQYLSVGEWTIAERLLVYRGEYVGRNQKVELPYWMPQQESFVLAVTPKDKPKPGITGELPTGIEVNFAHEPTDTLLVDFEGGELSHQRMADGKPSGKPLREAAPTEVLLLSPEGKLLALDSSVDGSDKTERGKERKERLDAWRTRIKDVREHKRDNAPVPGRNPFGGGDAGGGRGT